MVERALLYALIALALVGAASAVGTALNKMTERLECGWQQVQVCIIDGDHNEAK